MLPCRIIPEQLVQKPDTKHDTVLKVSVVDTSLLDHHARKLQQYRLLFFASFRLTHCGTILVEIKSIWIATLYQEMV